ncbi:purine-nucleoside phosphorylase [Citricoccus nitrophenolicus]
MEVTGTILSHRGRVCRIHGAPKLRHVTDTSPTPASPSSQAPQNSQVPQDSPLTGDHPGFAEARQAAAAIAEATGVARHRIAVVLGSGWGGAAELIGETTHTVSTADLPGFAAPSVPGHNPTVRSVRLRGDGAGHGGQALVFGSRTHYYEHRDAGAVAHTVRTAAAAGAETVVLTNGCGSLVPEWGPGTPVLVADHLNLTGATPLVGAEFVDLTDLYSPRIRAIAREVDSSLPEGVYAQFPGPQYETPAEVRYAKAIGGDLVGMSTALDAIAARHAGLEVFGMSLVTNAAAGFSGQPLSHDEVVQAGRDAGPRISALLAGIIDRL